MVFLSVSMLGGYGLAYWLCQLRSLSLNFSVYTSLVVTFGAVTGTYLLLDPDHTGVLYLLCSAISLALLSLNVAIVWTALGLATTAFIVLWRSGQLFSLSSSARLDDTFSVWTNLLLTEFIILVLFIMLAFLYRSMEKANKLSLERSAELAQALEALEQQWQQGSEASQQVLSTTLELNATATQQASNAHHQVLAVNQVTTSWHALAETSLEIAQAAREVKLKGTQVKLKAEQVQLTASKAANSGQTGQQVVKQTVSTIGQVGQLYTHLLDTLATLSTQAKDIRKVLGIITTISDETHLLALNAAIEASSAGERGDRFGVIAQEVKTLANRSLLTGKEVRAKIALIEEAVSQASLVAQSGQAMVATAISKAERSGEVIDELAEVTRQAFEETSSIAVLIHQVQTMAQEIDLATDLQQQAGQQVIGLLSSIDVAANQTSASSQALSSTALVLEGLSFKLNRVLAN